MFLPPWHQHEQLSKLYEWMICVLSSSNSTPKVLSDVFLATTYRGAAETMAIGI